MAKGPSHPPLSRTALHPCLHGSTGRPALPTPERRLYAELPLHHSRQSHDSNDLSTPEPDLSDAPSITSRDFPKRKHVHCRVVPY
jgi:hypothetical protein